MHTPEWHEKKRIKQYLDSIGVWHFSPYMAGRGGSGVPDIIACIAGDFVGIEVKRPGAKPTKLQEMRMTQIRGSGGITIWGDSENVIDRIRGAFDYI